MLYSILSYFLIYIGSFRQQFVTAGRYYVWSGYVDIYGIKNYHGTIEVVSAESKSSEISVKVGKAEALHRVGGNEMIFK